MLAVLQAADNEGDDAGGDVVEIFLDRTPFYAESGGQVGDTGTIVTESGIADVYDTVFAVPGLIAHRARLSGEMRAGQDALATIDVERREAIRRNHTATHLLHAALRSVLGDHVRQQGSLVSPEYLRFDFSHHSQPTRAELDEVFALANSAVLTDVTVGTTETSREEAEKMGAIAFFGDKYGSSVRVVQAGPTSLEFCGGTHVDSLGQIGPVTLVSEGSIGSNTRRIFALTGHASLERALERERLVQSAAELLRTEPEELVAAIGRMLERRARGGEGAVPAAAAVERGGGEDVGGGGGGRQRRGRGPARQRRARRAAEPGAGGPAPRRGASGRARGLAGRVEGGDRRSDRRVTRCHPARAHTGRPGGRRGRGLARSGAGGGQGCLADRGGVGRGAAASVRVSDDGGGSGRRRGRGRVAALDLGARRIGVAFSDSGRSIASPWGTIERSGDPARDRSAVVHAVREVEASTLVVGLPLSLSGEVGPAARAALQEVSELRVLLDPLGISVETVDERFTTVEAQRSLRASGRTGKAARKVIDSAAAMVLLQAWLDHG